MLSINSNIPSLNAIRVQAGNQSQLSISLQRLSSGLRINSAKDDAAGLAISSRMETQIRGMNQARRNINDGVSMVQTSEGALGKVSDIIQRGRELAIQAANATVSKSDRADLQLEIDQLLDEVNRISSTTEFNSVKLFDGGDTTVTYDPNDTGLTPEQAQLVDYLKRSWLEQGEAMVQQYFGITADGAGLEIKFVEDQSYLAAISFTGYDAEGKAVNLTLNIDLNDFLPAEWPNGGPSFISDDRIIAHELTHAVMSRSINMQAMPLWFIEGTAEFIQGADARLYNDLSIISGNTTAEKVQTLMNGYLTNDGSTQQYSAGYAAVRYLHQAIINEGGTGIKEVFDYLEANAGSNLDDAIAQMKASYTGLAFSNLAEFQGIFDVGEDGNAYVANLFDSGSLQNTDTGAVGGADADNGNRDTTPEGVVPDISNPSENPLTYFDETFPSTKSRAILLAASKNLQFQVGSNAGESIQIDLVGINAGNLGISDIDLVNSAQLAIDKFDVALDAINSERARLGAIQNRLEYAASNIETNVESTSASRSRIIDTDFAQETAALTRSNILMQASNAVIAQANSLPNIVLSLLNA